MYATDNLNTNEPQHRFYTTGDILDLISSMREVDPGAASHTLVGLLRMACENEATAVEQTALRIAGLGDMQGGKFVLTEAARELLTDCSSGAFNGNPASNRKKDEKADDPVVSAEVPELSAPEPVARLKIGGVHYDIGELTELDMLAFRKEGDEDWLHLNNTVEEGWKAIAAEIIAMTRDTTREYIRMHMIHRRDAEVGEDIRLFDLYGYEWFVRLDDNGAAGRIHDGEWVEFDENGFDREEELGQIAVLALLAAFPEAEAHFKEDVQGWARRIAAGASIMPAFAL